MFISGAIAGIGGAVIVTGVNSRFIEGFSPGFGWDGVAVASLAGLSMIGNIFSSFLFSNIIMLFYIEKSGISAFKTFLFYTLSNISIALLTCSSINPVASAISCSITPSGIQFVLTNLVPTKSIKKEVSSSRITKLSTSACLANQHRISSCLNPFFI